MNDPKAEKTSQLSPERIGQLAWGYAPPLIIGAAVRHGLFDLLDSGPLSLEEITSRAAISARGASSILNALAALELVRKGQPERYALTPESAAFLVSTKPGFQGGIFRHIDRQLLPKWLDIAEIVRTGRPATGVNQEQTGAQFFQEFVEDIFPMSYAAAQTLGDALKLAESKQPVRVLDLAAGSGVWGVALAQKSPQVRVTAVDWAGVIPVTRKVAARFGLTDRFTFVEGDLLTADFGRNHHIATLGHILHSEGPERSRKLLRRTFEAMAPGGTIAIAEFVLNETRTGPLNAAIFAVNMLVNTDDGDAFTQSEIAAWLEEAGFTNVRTLEAPAPSPLVLADKAA